MFKQLAFGLFFLLGIGQLAAQNEGKIKGTVKYEDNVPVEFATVIILSDGIIQGGANTDENGEYSIAPVSPGIYEVRASFAGSSTSVEGVEVKPNEAVVVDMGL